jgi:hypothetical protein
VFLRIVLRLWAAPVSVLGLLWLVVARLTGGTVAVVDGVLEVAGGWPAQLLRRMPVAGPVAAMTLGHVVVAVSVAELAATRTHEREHVRQTERWGAMFLLAYPLASLVALWCGGDAYRDNVFERAARAAARRER